MNFVAGKIVGGKRNHAVAYLTDEDENILFELIFLDDVDFDAILFQDLNRDGLKDIVFVFGYGQYIKYDDSLIYADFLIQQPDGFFVYDDELIHMISDDIEGRNVLREETLEALLDSDRNLDIESFADYLSKMVG